MTENKKTKKPDIPLNKTEDIDQLQSNGANLINEGDIPRGVCKFQTAVNKARRIGNCDMINDAINRLSRQLRRIREEEDTKK